MLGFTLALGCPQEGLGCFLGLDETGGGKTYCWVEIPRQLQGWASHRKGGAGLTLYNLQVWQEATLPILLNCNVAPFTLFRALSQFILVTSPSPAQLFKVTPANDKDSTGSWLRIRNYSAGRLDSIWNILKTCFKISSVHYFLCFVEAVVQESHNSWKALKNQHEGGFFVHFLTIKQSCSICGKRLEENLNVNLKRHQKSKNSEIFLLKESCRW